jgi:integral membrane protein
MNTKGARGALLRYRIMAYVVGVLLVVLVLIGMPLKYIWDIGIVVTITGLPHGWLYMLLLITAYDLGRRVDWPWSRMILIMLAGTVPFVTFVAEHYATIDAKQRIEAAEQAADAPPSE